jgi:hypothetical protein
MPVTKGKTKGRLIDFALYVAIALAVVVFAAIYAEHAVRTGQRGNLPLKWIGLVGETAALFGYVARAMRSYWGNSRFWAGFLGFFAAHSVAFVIVLLRVQQFGLLWFVFIGYAEWLALAYLLGLLLREDVRPDPARCHRAP